MKKEDIKRLLFLQSVIGINSSINTRTFDTFSVLAPCICS